MQLKIEYLSPEELRPYANNAKLHPDSQIEQIANSIKEFDFADPIGIWGDNEVVEGHGRLLAALRLGLDSIPVIRLDHLTDEQRRAYALAHNQTTLTSGWDAEKILEEIGRLTIDVEQFGFDMSAFTSDDWFESRERNDTSRQEGNDEYNEFLDKFEEAKTTDDCYTPNNIYGVVADYVETRYNAKRSSFVRPFYPGGDYQSYKYKPDDIVVDNPPFSILAQIIDWYVEHDQKFFLFAPGLSTIGYTTRAGVAVISTYASVTYENGAKVTTSFLTNMEPETMAARSDPGLYAAIERANTENEEKAHKHFPKYEYPAEVITSAKLGYLSKYGQNLEISKSDSTLIRILDAQKERGNAGIFGGGLLLSSKAAAEKAAAEKAAAEKVEEEVAITWNLSDREREIIRRLDKMHESVDMEKANKGCLRGGGNI